MVEGVRSPPSGERPRAFPGLTILFTAACISVFMYQMTLTGDDFDQYQTDHGFIPKQIVNWIEDPGRAGEPLTLLTYPLVHQSELHILSNLFFLWLFVMVCGRSLEAVLGHAAFLLVAVASALAGAALQVALHPDSTAAVVGAGGVVSGLLGAAFALRPKANAPVVVPWLAFSLALDVAGADLLFFVHLGGLLAGAAVSVPFCRCRGVS